MIPAPLLQPLAHIGALTVLCFALLVIWVSLALRHQQRKQRAPINTDPINPEPEDAPWPST